MSDPLQVTNPEYVALLVKTSKNEFSSSVEKRFPKSVTVGELKEKLELVTGASARSMMLELYEKEDTLVSRLDNDAAPLGSYHVSNGMSLHVIDNFTLINEDEAASGNYYMSLEEYEKRPDSIRAYLKKHKLGKYNEAEAVARQEALKKEIMRDKELAITCKVGDRCEVNIPGEPIRRGTIRYVGEVANLDSWWIGVQYDGPFGIHNGIIDGKTYFQCPDNCGAMVRPIYVTVGDFPEMVPEADEL